ncbi:CATRA conflict system CASPASE/TPR repeat-associated protein [Cryptosporangium arvum]|uniref:Putative nucleotide-binding protein containing TIR-like domain n=1 Tax=Cryptosporangium arvum DSM 44712 TaxID=927661 RepID=A0A010YLS5_9ACTN|nr:CATRA conflict system CASPASE/TPR repeat-associated protein [Cryptosporangium arvum]EXG81175.1 putative nucleotide-binding protein containing TIR-like domain [Cryptosporangium arvum DSM 44712]
MTNPAEPELVVHVFAPVDGPRAAEGYAAVRELWRRCRTELGMTSALSGSGPSTDLPATLDELPDLTAQKAPDRLYQAILRRFPTSLSLSVLLSPGDAGGWSDLEREWAGVAGSPSDALIGVAYLYLGKVSGLDGVATTELDGPEDRSERRFQVLAGPADDERLSAWTWSDGTTAMPPFARYLRHAASVRYQLRAWQAADEMRRVQERLDRGAPLAEARADLAFWMAAVPDLDRNLEHAAADMRQVPGVDPAVAEDDFGLIEWFRQGLADDLAHLRGVDDRARALSALPSKEPATVTNARDVFVIHGRDEEARRALWSFLQAIDLHPLDWEDVVRRTGSAAPYMGEVLEQAFRDNQAAIVLLTPDDGAYLHPDLQGAHEPHHERVATGQARPNVLLEAGMALALQRERTIVVEIGALRPVSDMGGLNVIKFDGTVRSLQKIAGRLAGAGCAVNTGGTDWLDVSRLANLAAYSRSF